MTRRHPVVEALFTVYLVLFLAVVLSYDWLTDRCGHRQYQLGGGMMGERLTDAQVAAIAGEDKAQRPPLRGHGLTYMHVFADLRAAARKCGYALAVHGSLDRDLDLVAIPWIEEATDAETLVAALCAAWTSENGGDMLQRADDPAVMPHGRRAWSLLPGGPAFVDLSVMPRVLTPTPPGGATDA